MTSGSVGPSLEMVKLGRRPVLASDHMGRRVGLALALAGCIVPTPLHEIPKQVEYRSDCVCKTCAVALDQAGNCPQQGFDFPTTRFWCAAESAKNELEAEQVAKDWCAALDTQGKWDCQLQTIDPNDSKGSTVILATTDAVCPQDGTGSASSAIITTPESALVAVDSARSWFEINSASGSLHARVAGTLYVRGANCNGSGCPIAIDRITLETAEPAVFKRKHGDPIQIVRPYVINAEPAEGLTSSFIAGNPSGFEFSIAKNALHLWASGAVDGKRQLVNARNAERVGNGRIMHDGELAFDGDVKVAGITLRVHLAGHIRSWPPYVRSITYTWDSAGTLSVLVEATAVSKSAVTATLIVNGDTRFVLPIGKPFVARGVNKGDKLATYVCADGHCVLRPHLLERKR